MQQGMDAHAAAACCGHVATAWWHELLHEPAHRLTDPHLRFHAVAYQ